MRSNYPPLVNENDKVILFDGVCKLCNAWSRFIIKHDTQLIFKLASVQSNSGQNILKFFSMPTNHFDTMLYVEGNTKYVKSDAFLKIISQLGLPWKIASVFWLIPRPIRNWLYDRIALNRYLLFGKHEHCLLPRPDHKERFLSDD